MSAPVAAEVLRELGAEPRKFKSPKQAMLWYRDELAARLCMSRDPSSVGTGSTKERRDQKVATFATLSRCMPARHRSDSTITSMAMQKALPMTGERLSYLVAWYENTYGNGDDLARKWDPNSDEPRWKFIRWCQTTERVLRHRLEAENLLEANT